MNKINKIQGLRGISIILIVLWHLNSIFPGSLPKTGDKGVEFFFLISGFLVARKYYFNSGLYSFRNSFSYAYKKIKSMYFLYILSALLGVYILFSKCSSLEDFTKKAIQLLCYCTVVQSWVPSSDYYWAFNGVMWFLSSIAFCYFITPIYLKIVRKIRENDSLLLFISILFFIEIIARAFLSPELATYVTYICPLYRSFDYAIGITVFIMFHNKKEQVGYNESCKGYDVILLLILCMYIAISLIDNNNLMYCVYRIFEISIFWFIVCSESCWIEKVFAKGMLKCIGDKSMIVFYIHLPIIQIVSKACYLTGIQNRFLTWSLCVIAISITTILVDTIIAVKKKKG